MRIRDLLSKEHLVNGIKSLGKLRIKISHGSIMTFSALILILFISFTIRMLPLRWEIQTGSIHLSEFDPYFQYRLTQYVVNHGLDGWISWAYPQPWIDTQRWYPNGINVARQGYPSVAYTAAALYEIVSALGVQIDLMSFCALVPPILGMLASLAIYFLGKDIGGKSVGLFAALLLALSPSYIQRTSLGFFDDETIGIVALLLFAFMFLRAIEEDRSATSSVKYSIGSGLALGYFSSGWGAAYYPIGVAVLFVLALILFKRYTRHLFLSYSLTFGLGLFISINVPKLTSDYLTAEAILPVALVFVLLCLNETIRTVTTAKWKVISVIALLAIIAGAFGVFWQLGYMRQIGGKFISVLDPFIRAAAPLIESVAEHRITAWSSIYYEFGIAILFFMIGVYFLLKNLNNRNLFLLIFGLTSLYFGSSMVRLLVLMAPAYSLLAAVGIIGILKPFNTLINETPKITVKRRYSLEHVGKEYSGTAIFLIFLVLMTNFAFPMPKVYKQSSTPVTITAGSLSISPNAPVREWFDMLQYLSNLPHSSTTVAVSWWDDGYWLTVLGNVTSLADNATVDTKQIENIGFIFMANETQSMMMLKRYNAKYILVFDTFDSGGNWLDWAGGDNGKWIWMAKISGNARQRFIQEGLVDDSTAWSDENKFGSYNNNTNKWEWNDQFGKNSTVYKLMSWAKNQWCSGKVTDPDAASVNQPVYFKEAFFSGKSLSVTDAKNNYGGVVPLVALYEVDWSLYNSEHLSS